MDLEQTLVQRISYQNTTVSPFPLVGYLLYFDKVSIIKLRYRAKLLSHYVRPVAYRVG